MFLVFRSPTAFPHHLRHHRLRLYRFPSLFGFGRSSFFRSICHGLSRPIFRFVIETTQTVSVFRVYLAARVNGRFSSCFSFSLKKGPKNIRVIVFPVSVSRVLLVRPIAIFSLF